MESIRNAKYFRFAGRVIAVSLDGKVLHHGPLHRKNVRSFTRLPKALRPLVAELASD